MVDILQSFEQASGQLSPLILIGPGGAALVLGLFVWLGGIGLRKWLLAVVGGLSGAVCGLLIIGRNLPSTVAFAGIGAAIAAIFQRLFIAVLTTALTASIVFCVLARPYVADARPAAMQIKQSNTLSWGQSARRMKSYAIEFDAGVRQVCSQMPDYSWAILVAAVVGGAVGGYLFWRIASALCCGTLGTMLIFAGMILLLLQKGSAPISCIFRKPPFYAIVFGAMVVLGSAEQLILCKQEKQKAAKAEKPGKGSDESPSVRKDWRTA